MNVKFNIASLNDVEDIIKLCNLVFEENTSLEYATKMFEETKNKENDIYIVGRIDDKIVAHAKVTIIKTIYEDMNTYAILNHVCVHPDYRRQSLATKMLDEITKICKERNVKTMKLWSNYVRTAAHACYKNYGFNLDDAGFFSKRIDEELEYEN